MITTYATTMDQANMTSETALGEEFNKLTISGSPGPSEDRNQAYSKGAKGNTLSPGKLTSTAFTSGQDIELVTPDHSYFVGARALSKTYGLPKKAFENFQELLCGNRKYPFILLLNPKHDDKYFDVMVKKTYTLRWLRSELEAIGFNFKDIIIMDMYPMLTDKWLRNNRDKSDVALNKMFDLTLEFIEVFKPRSILAFQCEPQGHLWKVSKYPELANLKSSMEKAEKGLMTTLTHKGHDIHVIYGFHPAKIAREKKEGHARRALHNERLLKKIICSSFEPYKRLERTRSEMMKNLRQLYTSGEEISRNYTEYLTVLERDTDTNVVSKKEIFKMLATPRDSIIDMCASARKITALLDLSRSSGLQ